MLLPHLFHQAASAFAANLTPKKLVGVPSALDLEVSNDQHIYIIYGISHLSLVLLLLLASWFLSGFRPREGGIYRLNRRPPQALEIVATGSY